MPLQKNQLLTLRIERLSSDGSGVAHSADGEAVFVPNTAPGDEARIKIVKDCGRYAFGILDQLLTPSPDRVEVDCPAAGPCGGCSLRHLSYKAELQAKHENVTDAFRRIGGLDVPVLPTVPSPEVDRYRNKVQFPVGRDKNGQPCIGFYAGRTHRIVPCPDCKLQPGVLNEIGNALCAFFAAHGIQPYDEESGKGLVRHIFLRRGAHSGQIMVCLVCTRAKLPHSEELVAQLREQFPAIATILLNVNAKNTNVILGSETHPLYGPGYLEDTLCGVPVRLGPLSFYQVNTLAAEQLYGIAAQYAQLTPDDLLLDLYCGMGTIGLSMVDHCRELVGVEIVPEAIESAKANAARMGDAIATKSRFFCADAGAAATRLAAEGLRPDVIVLVLLLLWGKSDAFTLSIMGENGLSINLYTILFIAFFGIGYGAYYATADMPIPMVADCSDYETYRSGNYIPGIMGTLFSLVDKLVSSLSATVVGVAVSFIGLESLPTQYDPYTPGMNRVVIVLFCIIPMVAWAATLIAMKGYSLTGEKMKEIQAVNACRRDAVANGMKLEEAMTKWQTLDQLPAEYRG